MLSGWKKNQAFFDALHLSSTGLLPLDPFTDFAHLWRQQGLRKQSVFDSL